MARALGEAQAVDAFCDAIQAFTPDAMLLVAEDGTVLLANAGARRSYDREVVHEPRDIVLPPRVRDAERARLQRVFEAGEVVRYTSQRKRADGTSLEVDVVLAPVMDDGGTPIAALEIAHDATRESNAIRLLRADLAVARALVASDDPETVLPVVVRLLREALGWDVGEFWLVDQRTDRLRHATTAVAPDANVDEFVDAADHLTFARDQGVPGQAWATRAPLWITDITQDSTFPRLSQAARLGLHTAFAFPVPTKGRAIAAVLAFFTRERLPQDDALVSAAMQLANQVGEYILRMEAERELRRYRDQLEALVKRRTAALARSERLYRLLAENSTDVISLHAPDGTIRYVSPASRHVLGYDPAELIGIGADDYVHPDDLAHMEELAPLSAKTSSRIVRFRIRQKTGEYRWVETAFRLLDNGEIMGVTRDARVAIESESRIHALNEELRERVEGLRSANDELARFAETAARELTVPLRRIRKQLDDLLDSEGALTGDARDALARTADEAEALDAQVMAVLDHVRVEHFVEREIVDVSDIARGILADLATSEPKRRVIAAVDDGLRAAGDPELVELALSHLLQHAWRATRAGDEATIRVGARDVEGDRVFFVEDDGDGFDMATAHRLFLPRPSKRRDTGELGLATAMRIVQRHGGRIWAQSQPGAGATLYFTLAPPAAGSRAKNGRA